MWQADQFRFVLNQFDGDGALYNYALRHLWTQIVTNGLKVEDRCPIQSGVVQYLSTNQMLMHRLLNDA